MPQRAKTRVKKKKDKITIETRKGTAKQVVAKVDGEPVANVIKVSRGTESVFLTSLPQAENPAKTLKAHHTEEQAVKRFSRQKVRITPVLRRRL